MDQRIIRFIDEQQAASICCQDAEGHPYCFTTFFAFDAGRQLLFYKSSADSYHAHVMEPGHKVAGTILPDKLNPLAIKGVQFTGTVLPLNDPLRHAGAAYYAKYPFAIAMPGDLWTVQVEMIKYTDNTLGFGKKTVWRKEEELSV
jgi:uncharacterized protein